jgi:biopolymer transport protein ExbD
MNRPSREFNDQAIAGVNIVPVIDLCLVILVVLLVISPMLDAPSLKVDLPKASAKDEKENTIAITIDTEGRMAVNADVIDKADLPKILPVLLLEQGEDTVVVIRSDKNVSYGALTDLLKIVKTAGAKRISLGTEPPKDQPQ